MSTEAMKRIKSLLQDTKMIDSHTVSAVVAECDMAILAQQPATGDPVAWNSIQIASWIGSQLMHEPSMFERATVCKFVRSLGRHPTLIKHSPKTLPAPSVPADVVLDCYDAGILNDFGGGNVEWWQDYIRAELGHAHDFYQSQIATPQAAQVQGEAFGYIHHFAAHDERGVLIDTTWEADGCADPLPHPTSPSMWEWTHCTPFYTTPQPAQATQAEVTDSMIREAFLANGFTVKDGHSDLKPYVYAAARAILALRAQAVPMTGEQRQSAFLSAPTSSGGHRTAFMLGIQFAEAHHGITAQAKKEAS